MDTRIINKMIEYFGHDVKRINHALKVYSFAVLISENEINDDFKKNVVRYSAILHDIGIKEAEKKYNSSAGKFQEIEGPSIARQILSELNIDLKIIDRVCFIIANHHTYSKIDDTDFQILVEADFLVNIYEDEIPKENIMVIKDKIFKTTAGIYILIKMYL
jgi:HD superfamily phosphodiesterase